MTEELSLHLGDLIQNLRAALDYIAWQVRPQDDTYFPIRLTEDETGAFGRLLADMPADVADAIRRLQPYSPDRGASDCPLWLLHELARRERHRLLLVTSGKVWTTKNEKGENLITVALQETGPAKGANLLYTCDAMMGDVEHVVLPEFRRLFPTT